MANCINLQLPIVLLKKLIIYGIIHRSTCILMFSKFGLVDHSKPCMHTTISANNRQLHKFATTNSNLEKSIISDIHHSIMYMCINFQQNRVSRSVKTAHTNLFAYNRKLHKFATCNLQFEFRKITPFRLFQSILRSKINQLSRSVRTAFQSYFYRRRTCGRTDIASDDIR